MPSQVDLDQGGTAREWVEKYFGPSVGWVRVPSQNLFPITNAGTYFIDPSTSLITVAATGSVTIILPSCLNPSAGAQAQPGLFAKNPITIVDILGTAQGFPINIQPIGPSETIMGLTSIQISVNFGGFTLQPNPTVGRWNSISP